MSDGVLITIIICITLISIVLIGKYFDNDK